MEKLTKIGKIAGMLMATIGLISWLGTFFTGAFQLWSNYGVWKTFIQEEYTEFKRVITRAQTFYEPEIVNLEKRVTEIERQLEDNEQ